MAAVISISAQVQTCYETGVAFQEQHTEFNRVHPSIKATKKEFKTQVLSFVGENHDLDRSGFQSQIASAFSTKTAKKVAEILRKVDIAEQKPVRSIEIPSAVFEAAEHYSMSFTELEDEGSYQAYRAAKKAYKAAVMQYFGMGMGVQALERHIILKATRSDVDPAKMVKKISEWFAKRA